MITSIKALGFQAVLAEVASRLSLEAEGAVRRQGEDFLAALAQFEKLLNQLLVGARLERRRVAQRFPRRILGVEHLNELCAAEAARNYFAPVLGPSSEWDLEDLIVACRYLSTYNTVTADVSAETRERGLRVDIALLRAFAEKCLAYVESHPADQAHRS